MPRYLNVITVEPLIISLRALTMTHMQESIAETHKGFTQQCVTCMEKFIANGCLIQWLTKKQLLDIRSLYPKPPMNSLS